MIFVRTLFFTAAVFSAGCMMITIKKHDPIPVKTAETCSRTNIVGVVEYSDDAGYTVKYWNFGLWMQITDFRITKNGKQITVEFGSAACNVSSNMPHMIQAGGSAAGHIVEGIVEGIK